MLKIFALIGLCSLALLCPAGVQTTQLQVNDDLTVRNLGANRSWDSALLQFYMTLGPKGAATPMGRPEISGTDGQLKLQWKTPEYRWQVTLTPQGRMIQAASELTNLTGNELWIEPEIRLENVKNEFRQFWDGFGHMSAIKQDILKRTGIKGEVEKHVGASTMPFPVSGAVGEKDVLFVGGVPFDPVSYTAGSWDPAKNALTYSIRLVVAPKQTVSFRHVLGRAGSDYGAQEAVVQQYYEAYPECWAVIMGQDNPYVWGAHGQYISWWKVPDPEVSRRLDVTLEWTYCPYKRSGDMLGREEYWDYKAHSPFRSNKAEIGKTIDMGTIGREEYNQRRKEIFHRYGRRYGLMFYNTVAGTWCELDLARSKYPDAITHDKDVMYILNVWSTHHDREIRVFPMGTSFGEVFESDMKELVKELDLPGFALDCAYGGAFYRGPAVEKDLPGRAWDDQGKFIDQNVAINREVDFIHNMVKDPKRRLTAFINGYLKGDYVMVETPLLNTGKMKRWMPLLRWYIGPRPGCSHGHGFLLNEVIPDWRNWTPEDLREQMVKLSDFVILNQFKYGIGSSYLTQYGNPQELYALTEAHELMRAGWQAEIPMVLEDGMRVPYRARYGRGVNTYFYLANSGADDVKGNVRFDNSALDGNGLTMLFVRKMRDKAEASNLLSGNFTQLAAELPSRVPVVYEAVAGIRKPAEDFSCEVRADKQLNEQRYRIQFNNRQAFSTPVTARDIRGFELARMTLNGANVAPGATVEIKPGSVLEITYRSTVFRNPAADILAFPFTDAGKQISFNVQANTDDGYELARRFNDYFDFCRKNKVIDAKSKPVELKKIANPTPAAGTVTLMIGEMTGSGPDGVSVSPEGGIIIKAADAESADRMITALFKVMDQRYEYVFPFSYVMGLKPEMIQHFQMWNKAFPYKKYFEVKQ